MGRMIQLSSGTWVSPVNLYCMVLEVSCGLGHEFPVGLQIGEWYQTEYFASESLRQHFVSSMYSYGNMMSSQLPVMGSMFKPCSFFVNTKLLQSARILDPGDDPLGRPTRRIILSYPAARCVALPDLPTADAERFLARLASG